MVDGCCEQPVHRSPIRAPRKPIVSRARPSKSAYRASGLVQWPTLVRPAGGIEPSISVWRARLWLPALLNEAEPVPGAPPASRGRSRSRTRRAWVHPPRCGTRRGLRQTSRSPALPAARRNGRTWRSRHPHRASAHQSPRAPQRQPRTQWSQARSPWLRRSAHHTRIPSARPAARQVSRQVRPEWAAVSPLRPAARVVAARRARHRATPPRRRAPRSAEHGTLPLDRGSPWCRYGIIVAADLIAWRMRP